ncbi:hypothetical protein llg_28550 [Luteolibacter sp. LG18]|nr:hypothetical protein llg_28550 [Luteolibacter sp. LG18]
MKRAIALTPVKEVQAKESFKEVLDGGMWDTWRVNRSETEPPPELLPWSVPPFLFKHEIKRAAIWVFLGFAIRSAWKTWRKRKHKEELPRFRLYPPSQTRG